MKRTTALVWNLVLLALVGAGLGVSPAGAQEATTDVLPPAIGSISVEALIETAQSEDPQAGAGFRSRVLGLEGVRALNADLTSQDQDQILQPLANALRLTNGDFVTDDKEFDETHAALVKLANWGRKNKDARADEAANYLALSDRVAAVVQIRFAQNQLDLTEAISTKDREKIQKTLDQAWSEVEKGDSETPAQAVKRYQLAWRKANAAGQNFRSIVDADGDFLDSDLEEALGIDPNSNDSDGDGLGDITEIWTTFTDPATADTGAAGVPDGERDPDQDGLSNLRETENFSDPLLADTDEDGLDDGFEVDEFGSSPASADTDDDGLDDLSEFELGTDPNNPDSNGNGVLDGDEVYTTQAGFEAQGVTVAITGQGNVGKTVELRDRTDEPTFQGVAGVASALVDIDTTEEFSSATITIPYDETRVPNNDTANLSVFFFDEELATFVPVDGPVVVNDDGTVSATTSHFTLFAVFYVPEWNAVFEGFDPNPGGPGGPADTFVDITLVLDSSGSMAWNDPQGVRRTASKNFIDALIEGDRVAVIDFDSSARVFQSLTQDFEAAKSAVDRINSSGGTNIGRAVSLSNTELINNGDPDHVKISILLTDGDGSYSNTYTQQAADNDITIYTIGLGAGVNATLLQGIADGTGGDYFPVENANDLPDVFSRIPVNLDPFGDEDGDGLSNGLEQRGIVTSAGRTFFTDPFRADTDGDGLSDSEEVPTDAFGLEYTFKTDPTDPDTDGDFLLDSEEEDLGLSPRDPDEDNDGVDDGVELVIGFDPFEANADGDEFRDDEELAQGSDPFVYDLTGPDYARAAVAGALFGEAGSGVPAFDTSLKELLGDINDWADIPYLSGAVGGLLTVSEGLTGIGCWASGGIDNLTGWMGPFNPVGGTEAICDVLEFRIKWVPVWATYLPYMAGWIVVSFIPIVDIIVGLRDLVANLVKGQWGGAGLEAIFIVIGLVPVVGDAPKVAKVVTKFLKNSRTAVRAVYKFLATTYEPAFVRIVEETTAFTRALIDRIGGNAVLKELALEGTDLAKLGKFIERGGTLAKYGVNNSAELLNRVRGNWVKAKPGAASSTVAKLAAEAMSTEAAVEYLTRSGYDILYVGRNAAVQVADDAERAINKGPDIIAIAPNGRTAIIEVKGSSQASGLSVSNSTITSEVQRVKRVQTSYEWIATNADGRYLSLMERGADFDPKLAEAVRRVNQIIDGAETVPYDSVIVAASTNTRVGNVADSLVDADGISTLGNAGGSTSVIEIDVPQSLIDDTIDALSG